MGAGGEEAEFRDEDTEFVKRKKEGQSTVHIGNSMCGVMQTQNLTQGDQGQQTAEDTGYACLPGSGRPLRKET